MHCFDEQTYLNMQLLTKDWQNVQFCDIYVLNYILFLDTLFVNTMPKFFFGGKN